MRKTLTLKRQLYGKKLWTWSSALAMTVISFLKLAILFHNSISVLFSAGWSNSLNSLKLENQVGSDLLVSGMDVHTDIKRWIWFTPSIVAAEPGRHKSPNHWISKWKLIIVGNFDLNLSYLNKSLSRKLLVRCQTIMDSWSGD